MKKEIEALLRNALRSVGLETAAIDIDYPENQEHGDFMTNVALAEAKKVKTNPKALAEKIVSAIKEQAPEFLKSVEVAGPGFINLKIKDNFFAKYVLDAVEKGVHAKSSKKSSGKVLVEYTDPNTFKVFHIGHLMANAIGESLSRLIEFSGKNVIRMCYPSDIGLHIAKSVWAMKEHESEIPKESEPIQTKTAFLGKMYVEGVQTYDADPAVKAEIDAINKKLFEKSDKELQKFFETGRRWSLEHYELLYKILGTKFDDQIYESDMAPEGLAIVRKFQGKVFEESEGAVVFKGESHGLHTRVFVNSHGIPTYEAKELGLNVAKFKKFPDIETSIIVTASEQNDYFRVLKKVLTLIDENIGSKTVHVGHGMMRFASGKMSSRTGNVVTAETLLADLKGMVAEKMASRQFSPEEANEIAEMIAVAAIKYTVLRSSTGSDIVFDSVASISFEGDSGPYLQYSAVRAQSVLQKAGKETDSKPVLPTEVGLLEKLVSRFDDVAMRAAEEFAPQIIANYLIALASAFNSFYAGTPIIDKNEPLSPYRIALTRAFLRTITSGLDLLGIKVPKKM